MIARHAGLSEAELALRAIRLLLDRDAEWLARQPELKCDHVAASDRITIRLRPGEGLEVIRRATERGIKPATYISALVRAHITANPPLPAAEVKVRDGISDPIKMSVCMQDKQMQLSLQPPRPTRRASKSLSGEELERRKAERLPGIDQVLSTRDIERITGRHRCTIYRWVCAGTFPAKRAGGGRGCLRSDIERWLNGAG